MFTHLYLDLRALPQRLRSAWRHNRIYFFQFALFWVAVMFYALNRAWFEIEAFDIAVVLGVPLVSFMVAQFRLGRIDESTKLPHFESMTLHPVRSALWLQLIGSFVLLLQRTSMGPASFDDIFLWIFVLPIEWVLLMLLKRKTTPHVQAKLAVVFLFVFAVSFLFFTLASTA
jgi:hypothetical protein